MPKILERPETDVDVRSDLDTTPQLPVRERELVPPIIEMPPEPDRFVRWLGWLAVLVMVVGAGFLVWNTVTEDAVIVDATAGISSEQMDLIRRATTGYGTAAAVSLSPQEIMQRVTYGRSATAVTATTPSLTPQEIMQRVTYGRSATAITADTLSLTPRELLLGATTGYDFARDGWSSQTRDLLRSMPATP